MVVDIDPNELLKLDGAIQLAYLGDVKTVIRNLLDAVERSEVKPWTDVDGWVDGCQKWRASYPVVTDEHRELGATISTYRFAEVLSEALSESDVLALGCSGLGIEIFILALRLHTGQRAIFNNALGEMGAGPPTALGACVGSGGRRTICVDGDGGLQLNVQELETIRRLKLPVKLFVLSNDGYASIRASQNRWFGRLAGADSSSGVTLPPLEGIATA
ncbi:thiamine pyrophosphate protein domain protein TPP-binding protein, partial [mine drainage metagenome]